MSRKRNPYALKNLGDCQDVDAFVQHDLRDDLYDVSMAVDAFVLGVQVITQSTFLRIEYLDQSRQNLC